MTTPFRLILRQRAAGLLLVWLFLSSAETALAHGVYIFAWPDGQQICTESYFSGNSKVRDGSVSMADGDGRILGKAETNAEGIACFAMPARKQDLKFVVMAGPGHRAEFALSAQELAETLVSQSAEAAAKPADAPSKPANTSVQPVSVTSEKGPAAVSKSLVTMSESSNSATRQAQAESNNQGGPHSRDIIIGLGAILGLALLLRILRGRMRREKG